MHMSRLWTDAPQIPQPDLRFASGDEANSKTAPKTIDQLLDAAASTASQSKNMQN